MTIVSLPVTMSEALSYAILWGVMVVLVLAVGRLRGLSRRGQRLVAGPVISAALIAPALAFRFDADEGEHLHCAWLIAQGQQPFADFFQHHLPLIWYVLAPMAAALEGTPVLLDATRMLAIGLTVGAGALAVALARRLWGDEVDLWTVGLLVGMLSWLQMYIIRPDLLVLPVSLGAVLLFARGPRTRDAFLAGLLVGVALCSTPKHLPLIALGPLVALWMRGRDGPDLPDAAVYVGGALVAPALMVGWFACAGLLDDAWTWIYQFNAEIDIARDAGELRLLLPMAVAAFGVAGAVKLDLDGRLGRDRIATTVALAAGLALLSTLARVRWWDLQIVVFLAAPLAALPAKRTFGYLRGRSVILAGLALMIFFSRLIWPVAYGLAEREYLTDRAVIAALMRASEEETVLAGMPHHPVTAHDATPLWHAKQWWQWTDQPLQRELLEGFGEKLLAARPALIYAHEPQRLSSLDWFERQWIVTVEERARIEAMLREDYLFVALKGISGRRIMFWVRKDRATALPDETVVRMTGATPWTSGD